MKNITISPKLSEQERKVIGDWLNNLSSRLPAYTQKKFTDVEIKKLGELIRKSYFDGIRYESLTKSIQENYGISESEAELFAKQETLMISKKYQEARYAEAGVYEYTWHCEKGTPKNPTRLRHKALNDSSEKGQIFRSDDPPITSEPGEPERRNNPGFDPGCRCTAIPVVRFKK